MGMFVFWWPIWMLICVGCSRGTWADPASVTEQQVTSTEDKFKEITIFEDDDDFVNGTTTLDDRLITITEFPSTENTRSPKSEEDSTDVPLLNPDESFLTAFNKRVNSLAESRQTTPEAPRRVCGRRIARTARIVGGKETYVGEFPWAVSVRLLTTHSCGGTIINQRWILTAAHCVKRYAARYFRVRLGENNIGIRGFRTDLDIHVTEIALHPNFGKPRRYSNDVALLKLKTPIKYDAFAQPICLPDPDQDYAGQNATAVGWGAIKEENNDRPNKLHKVMVPILNNSLCAEWYADVYQGYVQIYDYQICAGYKEGGKDACQGDSGGPLVMREGDHYTLIGIVSAGVGCARKQLPGIYSRISLFVPWILKVTEQA